MRIHKEGWIYCIVATILYLLFVAFLTYILGQYAWLMYPLLILGSLLYVWVFWFFRIPNRTKTSNENLLIAPCDGKVVVIEEAFEPEYFKDKRLQISIFMSPLNVHVNTCPMQGNIAYTQYHKGKYLVAWHPKSSTENERSTVVIKNQKTEILLRQIAGAVARRIVTFVKPNDAVMQNDEFGFIKFGSRVDLFLPIGTQVNVKIGDVVQNSITPLATITA
ncbi:MAG: phosphatidylserine decarboxylase family protein [Chitinophagaceae bacterium]